MLFIIQSFPGKKWFGKNWKEIKNKNIDNNKHVKRKHEDVDLAFRYR